MFLNEQIFLVTKFLFIFTSSIQVKKFSINLKKTTIGNVLYTLLCGVNYYVNNRTKFEATNL